MGIALTFLSVTYAAVGLWLAVRIVNRRERWAKWTATALIAAPILYVLSFGPACWIVSRTQDHKMPAAYDPFWEVVTRTGTLTDIAKGYAGIGMPQNGRVTFLPPGDPEGSQIEFRVTPPDGRVLRVVFLNGTRKIRVPLHHQSWNRGATREPN